MNDICVFCDKDLKRKDGLLIGYNNPVPIVIDDESYCCDFCNDAYVYNARIGKLGESTKTPNRNVIIKSKSGKYALFSSVSKKYPGHRN